MGGKIVSYKKEHRYSLQFERIIILCLAEKVGYFRNKILYFVWTSSFPAELCRVRTRFIEKVSKALIRSLLDYLLGAMVLNQGESEEILEENCVTRDQARCLIDIIRKKGDHASNQMIDFIYGRDKHLHAEIGLSQVQPGELNKLPNSIRIFHRTFSHTRNSVWNLKNEHTHTYSCRFK